MKAIDFLKEKGIFPKEPIYWETPTEYITIDELMEEFLKKNKPGRPKQESVKIQIGMRLDEKVVSIIKSQPNQAKFIEQLVIDSQIETWINAKDQLPEQKQKLDGSLSGESDDVFTYSENSGKYFVTRYCHYFENWEYLNGLDQIVNEITHWAPLRKPPVK